MLVSNKPAIHNSSICSEEGLMLETSPFKLMTVANLHYQLS